MTTYVITVPGTFLKDVSDGARAELVSRLRPVDPQHTALGESEDLGILRVNDDGTFSIHLEVDAQNRHSAEGEATRLAQDALSGAGLPADAAALGPAVVTGIDGAE
jgi:hypothetical protein